MREKMLPRKKKRGALTLALAGVKKASLRFDRSRFMQNRKCEASMSIKYASNNNTPAQ